jgi:hypothetical protein
LGADSPEVSQYPGLSSQTGLEPSLPGRQLRAWQKATVFNVKDAEHQESRFVDV